MSTRSLGRSSIEDDGGPEGRGSKILPEEWDRLEVSFFWRGVNKESTIDMDANCLLFNVDGEFLEAVHFGHPVSTDESVRHMGDEIGHVGHGDLDSSEEIRVHLDTLGANVFALVMVFTCYGGKFHHLLEAGVCVYQLSILDSKTLRRGLMSVSLDREDLAEKPGATAIIMARLFRDKDHDFKRWALSLVGELAVVRKLEETIPASQHYLRDLIPHIVVKGEELLVTRVTDVIKLLSISNLKRLEANFPKFGCGTDTFISLIMTELCISNPKLRSLKQAEKLLGILQDMARQVDSYSRNVIQWSEFTAFCVDAETQSDHAAVAKGGECAVDVESKYSIQVLKRKDMQWKSFSRMVYLYGEDLLACLEDCTGTVKILRRRSQELVQVFSTNPFHVYPQSTIFNNFRLKYGAAAVCKAMDVVWVTSSALFIISTSNQVLSFWYFSSRGYSKLLHTVPCPVIFVRLMWLPRTKLLLTVGTDHCLWLWAVERRIPIYRLEGHEGIVTDVRLAPGGEDETVITCSSDQTIRFWNISTRVCDVVIHDQSSVKLACSTGGTLLTAGHNSVVGVWDLHVKERYCTCPGNTVPVVFIHLLEYPDDKYGTQVRGITGTEDGVFKIWNLVKSDCQEGEGILLKVVSPPNETSFDHLGRIISVTPIFLQKSIWPDLYMSSHKMSLAAFHSEPQPPPRSPVTCLIYNTHDTSFITAEDARVRFWDLTTSACQHNIALDHDVSSLAIEEPLNRRLYAGTINGQIYVISYLNGEMLGSCRPHHYPVMALFYCPVTRLLVSCGKYGQILVHVDRGEEESQGIEDTDDPNHEGHNVLITLRKLQSALIPAVDCAAFSHEMGLIAVAGAGTGLITLWDFYSMELRDVLGIKQGPEANSADMLPDGSTSCLRFVPGYPLLISGHTTGDVYVWEARCRGSKSPLRLRLTAPGQVPLSKVTGLSVDVVSKTTTTDIPCTANSATVSIHGMASTISSAATTVSCATTTKQGPRKRKQSLINITDAHGEVFCFPLLSVLSRLDRRGMTVEPLLPTQGPRALAHGTARGKGANAYTRVQRTVQRAAVKLYQIRAALQPAGLDLDDVPCFDAPIQWTAHEDGVICHCCPLSPHPVILTAGASTCAIRLWAMDELKFGDKDFETGGLMGEVITCDFEAERVKKAANWAFPRENSSPDKVPLKMRLLLVESIRDSMRPGYITRANSRRVVQRTVQAEATARAIMASTGYSTARMTTQQLWKEDDEGEGKDADQDDIDDDDDDDEENSNKTVTIRTVDFSRKPGLSVEAQQRQSAMAFTMATMASLASMTHQNQHQQSRRANTVAANFKLPALELPHNAIINEMLKHEAHAFADNTEKLRVHLHMQQIRAKLRSSYLTKNFQTGRIMYSNMYKEQHRYTDSASHRALKSLITETTATAAMKQKTKQGIISHNKSVGAGVSNAATAEGGYHWIEQWHEDEKDSASGHAVDGEAGRQPSDKVSSAEGGGLSQW